MSLPVDALVPILKRTLQIHLWLRDETKLNEKRTPLTPVRARNFGIRPTVDEHRTLAANGAHLKENPLRGVKFPRERILGGP